jgi:arylsulfatase A-like enzyme/tetratricopeptide (TPR) repeat protein
MIPAGNFVSKKKRSRSKKKRLQAPPPSLNPPAGWPGLLPKDSKALPSARKSSPKIRLILPAAVLVAAAVALFFVLKPSKIQVARDDKLSVLLITLDTMRGDRLGCYGYNKGQTPNLNALAQKGIRFANAYAQVPLTLPSHCSMMTGAYPISHGVHNNGTYTLGPDKLTLAEILKVRGFKTAAFLASFSLDSRFGLDQGFDVYDDNFQEGSPSERNAEQVYPVFSAWVDKLKDEQFFCWIHFFDPHLPYNPPPPYREEFADRPYDGEVAFMDSVIGAVIGKIKERNLLGRTLVIVAGDHGEGFGEKGESGHGVFVYEMALRVPLIFSAENHLPAQQVIPARVRLIDIMPTVLDLLNLPKPDSAQGISLIPYIQKKEKADLDSYVETYYPQENLGWASPLGLISRHWKYIRAPKEELYDLKADPQESKNVFLRERKKSAEMKNSLDAWLKDSLVQGSSGKRVLTNEEKEKLRSLGYVDYSDKTARGEAPDPKDKLDELQLIQAAQQYEFEGNFQAAAELHAKMLALRPSVATSYDNLALAQARTNKFEAAIQTLKRGLENIPHSEVLLSRLGHTCMVAGRPAEALSAMSDVLKINPKNMDALTASAMVLGKIGKKEEAEKFFEKALALDPENKFLRTNYANFLAAAGRIPEAIEVYQRLTQDFPQDSRSFQLLGITYGMIKEFDKAIENLKEAIVIRSTPSSYYYLALSFREKGNLAEAIRNLEFYLQDTRGEPEQRTKNAQATLEYLKKLPGK